MPHTPAPWHVDLEREFTQDGDVASVEALTPDRKLVTREICTVMLDTGENKDGEDWNEDAANAHLISMAPTLFEMVDTLTKIIHMRCFDQLETADRLMVKTAEAYIAGHRAMDEA